MSETETRPSQNVFDSETRPRPSKSGPGTGLKTKTSLEYYNANAHSYLWQSELTHLKLTAAADFHQSSVTSHTVLAQVMRNLA